MNIFVHVASVINLDMIIDSDPMYSLFYHFFALQYSGQTTTLLLMGQLQSILQVSTSPSRSRLFRGEDRHLFCMAGILHFLFSAHGATRHHRDYLWCRHYRR